MLNMFQTFLLINRHSMDEVIIGRAGRTMTKQKLKCEIELAMKGLAILGLKSGDVLMLHMPLLIEGVVLTFAANALGIKVAYANFEGTDQEFIAERQKYHAKIVAKYQEARVGRPRGVHFYRIVADMSFWASSYDALLTLAASANVKLRSQKLQNLVSRRELIYLQTSGSTAVRPKGLPFTNSNIFHTLLFAAKSTGTTTHSEEVDKALCILNFRHPYGWMPLFINLMGGNRVELAVGATAKDIGEWYRTRPSYIYGTPQFLREFIRETPKDADLSFLRAFFCAGDKTEEELFVQFREFCAQHGATQAEIRNNYGVGELLCVGTTSDGIPHRAGTSGKFYQGPTWVIVDEDLNPVPTGTVGEIIVHSKTMIRHYFQNEEETKKVFVKFNGKRFFRTGDYASVDADGYVTIVGRKKRFYIPRGSTDKVNCETIEQALLSITELVADCAVIIYALEDGSKSSCAFVVTKPDIPESDATRDRIFAWLRRLLRPFQLPTRIEFLSELPYMPSGKVNYIKLEQTIQP